MAIGNPVSQGGLNAKLGDIAVSWRDVSDLTIELWSYVASLGANQAAQISALQAIGFSAGDASSFWTVANGTFALSQIYLGIINQPAAFDYDSDFATARGAS